MSSTREHRSSVAVAAALAVLSVAVFAVTVRIALDTTTGQQWDDGAMDTVYAGRDTQLAVLSVLGRVSIGLVVAAMLVCVALALARGKVAWALGAVVVIAGSNISTQVLKNLIIDRPDLGLGTLNSLPSGHTTVVASAAAATLLVAPRALRLLMVVGGAAATTLTGTSTIVAGWHRPSDIIASLAVSLFWAAAVSMVLARRGGGVRGTSLVALIGAAGGLIGLVALGVRPTMGWDGFAQAAGVLGAVALATAAFVVAAAGLALEDDVSRETTVDQGPEAPSGTEDSAVRVPGPPLASDGPRA